MGHLPKKLLNNIEKHLSCWFSESSKSKQLNHSEKNASLFASLDSTSILQKFGEMTILEYKQFPIIE